MSCESMMSAVEVHRSDSLLPCNLVNILQQHGSASFPPVFCQGAQVVDIYDFAGIKHVHVAVP